MINNDILRRLRYALSFNDQQMLAIFNHVGHEITKEQLQQIMVKEGGDDFVLCGDEVLSLFLDGLIIELRGRQEGSTVVAMKTITTNDILRKLRIALNLKAEDMLAILTLANFRLSKGELSAFFRKPDHRNYKACGNQILRNFLNGLTTKKRGVSAEKQEEV